MTTVQFYHLTTTPLERALPKLLEKAYGGGFRTLLVAPSEELAEQLNQLLWTYDPGSFLPHGSVKDGHAESQPILIVTATSLPPRLRGGRGGDASAHHGKIGEGKFTSRDPEALANAKALRQNATDAENTLWYSLQKGNLGCSFRKQHPVGNYIADFACIEKKLIIEIDGGHHAERVEQDKERTAFLEAAGFKVMRFWNNEVMENIDGVLQAISESLQSEGHPPSPPASGGVKDFNLLLVTDGSTPQEPEAFERILDMFDGNNPQAVENARTRWTGYKNAGHSLTYLRQTQSGGWEQKAVV